MNLALKTAGNVLFSAVLVALFAHVTIMKATFMNAAMAQFPATSPLKGKSTVNTSQTTDAKKKFADLPLAITSFGAAVLEGSIYIYGGHHGEAHHYSVAGQSGELWQLKFDKPLAWQVAAKGPKLQGLALVAHGGKLYRLGGFTAKNQEDQEQDIWSVDDFARFDPKTGQWEPLPKMPSTRSSFDAAMVDNTLIVVGGWSLQGEKETKWQESAWAVDLSQTPLVWKELPKPGFQRRALSVGTLNGKVYAIGGIAPDGKVTTRCAVYDLKAETWSEGPPLPGDDMEGFGSACFPADGKLFVSTASGNVLRLSDDGKAWQKVEQAQRGRFFHRMLPIGPQQMILIGGANMKRGRYADIEIVNTGR